MKKEKNPFTIHRVTIAKRVLNTPDALFPFLDGGYKNKAEARSYLKSLKPKKRKK